MWNRLQLWGFVRKIDVLAGDKFPFVQITLASQEPPQAEACATKPMLKIGQLAQIKGDSPYVYEALTQLVNGVNAVGARPASIPRARSPRRRRSAA